jgi:hypothetical protein
VNISKFVIYARIQISVIKTREPEKAREGKEQTNEESETMTKSKKMNANYQEHDSKNQNKGGFSALYYPCFGSCKCSILHLIFCFVVVEYLTTQ